MTDLAQLIRQTGLAEAIQPARAIRQAQAVAVVVDETGKINRSAVAPFLPPIAFQWASGSTSRQRVPRAGTIVLLAAFASTAPSTGDATVTLTQMTEASGEETIATLRIAEDAQFGDAQPMVQVPAGAWLGAIVTVANGASGVSISCTMNVG